LKLSRNPPGRRFESFFIGLVFLANIQCAIVFIINPSSYIYGFGLEGAAGEQIVRAIGLLFLMWNVPYAFALANPIKRCVSLIEAVIMQAVGLIGETSILWFGGSYPLPIESTLKRFILFDGIGFVFLLLALCFAGKKKLPTAAR
jgi:hypothetical protein